MGPGYRAYGRGVALVWWKSGPLGPREELI